MTYTSGSRDIASHHKASVRVATTVNITLSGTQTVDGISLSVDDRVLVKDQSTGSQNGIYKVQSGSWVRTDDTNQSIELIGGTLVYVLEGSANGGKLWVLTTIGSITLGTTSLAFSQTNGMAIGGSITSATAGSVLFAGTSGVLQQDNANLFWDDTNNRLGIGTVSPDSDITVNKSINGDLVVKIKNDINGASASAQYYVQNPSGYASWGAFPSNYSAGGTYLASKCLFYNQTLAGGMVFADATAGGLYFTTGGTPAAGYERIHITSSDIIINDPGNDLDLRVEGNGTRQSLFHIDAGLARVGINRAAGTHGATLDVDNLAVAEDPLWVRDNGTAVWKFIDGGNLEMQADYDLLPLTDNSGEVGTDAKTFTRIRAYTNATNSIYHAVASKTSNYTATNTDHTILCNATGAGITITLPTAASASADGNTVGQILVIKKIDNSANTVTIDGDGTEQIDGALTQVLTAVYESITLQSNGTAWYII